MTGRTDILDRLHGRLIVSCQPVIGGSLDRTNLVVALVQAVTGKGTAGVRIERVARVATVREAVAAPVTGIVKIQVSSTHVRITPCLSDIDVRAGAPIIAFDATARLCPPVVIAMSDVSAQAEDLAAAADGADIAASMLSGYIGPGEAPQAPDVALVRALAATNLTIVAEGTLWWPARPSLGQSTSPMVPRRHPPTDPKPWRIFDATLVQTDLRRHHRPDRARSARLGQGPDAAVLAGAGERRDAEGARRLQ